MTRDEFKIALRTAGYKESTIMEGLLSIDRDTYPRFYIQQQEFKGYDLYTIRLNFDTDGMNIHFRDGHAGLLRVPVEHARIAGIDTAKLEERIAEVTWSHDHQFLAGEFPDDPAIVRNAEIIVPCIYQDLDKLYGHSPQGRLLAEELCCRHIIWRIGPDRNSVLPDLLEQKYYVSERLATITPPGPLYDVLAAKPVPDINITLHIGDFIRRQLNYNLSISQIPIIMNRNNLENLREEMTMLGFEPKIIAEMEQKMEKELPAFQLRTSIPGAKGQADFLLQFKKSGQSENFYLNRFDVTHNKVKPLEEGHKYMVISPSEEPGKNVHRKFDSPYEAIEYFKEQKGTSELASGKDIAHKTTLATMEKDKVNYVSKDFNRTYYAPVVTQSFYPDRGNGFTATQAANLIEGRAVYRDDLVNRGGVPYKAWVKLDMDSPKDNSHNYTTNQYNDPAYGFHLEQVLEKYNIKELDNPEQKQALIESLYNGNRPVITTVKDGQEVKMQLEAVPRYSQVNLYQQNGKPEKREQFLKEPIQEQGIKVEKGKTKEQEQDMALTK